MRKLRTAGAAAATAAALALTVAACSSDEGSGDTGTSTQGATTIDVWLMRDSISDDFQKEFVAGFEKAHPDVTVDVQVQEWDGIGQKIISALASDDAPDVIEVGNTQVAQYGASGGLADLTDKVSDLGGSSWIPGLAEPGNIDGKQYGIPYYAANRVVLYNKDLFTKAGITTPPKTRDEWLKDTKALDTGGNQGIYLAGQNWYTYAGFLWDEGGDLATNDGDTWKGGLDTPAAAAAMDFYGTLQKLGKGPQDADEQHPPQIDVFATGKVAQMIATPGAATQVTAANAAMADKIGFFPIPGKTADQPGAVFTGGSDLVIPTAAAHPDQAYTFIKELTGDEWQKKLAVAMSYVPNKTTLAGVLADDPGAAAMAVGAANGHATPNSPNWAAVEANNPVKNYMTQVLTGADPAAAGTTASDAITKTLNASS
ncbi:extracellular solute-binding protein [Luteimicrobium subarcticum]|uniref:Carbohydrate ABC transporter substrate-binding protein (CUT1 family) n=1 Tax=Luteimicrobium subarcticum TaxID=620910 RepID=A0A2M8WS03_9MICO|nr:extracellular solute-binding protein [Luteimicrobium subarcticum]PJI93717.1 carbohydrate ABC transporter substrate-binding protein (CUT1 family) [Luteimicrobium subarcticum]